MDYELLRSKIEVEYPTSTNVEIRNGLNAKVILVRSPIEVRMIKQYLILTDLWLPIVEGTSNASKIAVAALSNFEEFTVINPLIDGKLSQVLDALVTETQVPDFTEQNKADIMSMGDKLVSWADQNWQGDVTLWQIEGVING